MARPCSCDRVPGCQLCTIWHRQPDSPAARAWRGEKLVRTRAVGSVVHKVVNDSPPPTATRVAASQPSGRGCGGCGSRVPPPSPVSGPITFDRVVLINLKRRSDRLAAFKVRVADAGWALPSAIVVSAVDGRACGVPSDYTAGPGAYGCMRSHLGVLEQALTDGVTSLLVFEDDVSWDATTWPRLNEFLSKVPRDWDQLMLGGQHQLPTESITPGVVRCTGTERTHAYAVRGPAIRELYHYWLTCKGHIDHAMGRHGWQRNRNVYAPEKFLFGQAAGRSDINGRDNPAKLWAPPDPNTPLMHLTAPPAVVAELRTRRLIHTGYTRHPITDLDVGLDQAMKGPEAARPTKIRKWAETVLSEVEASPGPIAACWYPGLTFDELKEAISPRPITLIEATDVDTAISAIVAQNPSK